MNEQNVEAEARKMCFEMCRKGEFLDFESGCCSVCEGPRKCQSWRIFAHEVRVSALSQADSVLEQGAQQIAAE